MKFFGNVARRSILTAIVLACTTAPNTQAAAAWINPLNWFSAPSVNQAVAAPVKERIDFKVITQEMKTLIQKQAYHDLQVIIDQHGTDARVKDQLKAGMLKNDPFCSHMYIKRLISMQINSLKNGDTFGTPEIQIILRCMLVNLAIVASDLMCCLKYGLINCGDAAQQYAMFQKQYLNWYEHYITDYIDTSEINTLIKNPVAASLEELGTKNTRIRCICPMWIASCRYDNLKERIIFESINQTNLQTSINEKIKTLFSETRVDAEKEFLQNLAQCKSIHEALSNTFEDFLPSLLEKYFTDQPLPDETKDAESEVLASSGKPTTVIGSSSSSNKQ